jgi:hypothetical protein
VVVVLAAVAALRPAWARRPSFRPHPLVGGVAAVAVAAVVSASVTPSIAGEHQHGEDGGHDHAVEGETAASGGHDHGTGAAADVDPDDRGLDTTGPGAHRLRLRPDDGRSAGLRGRRRRSLALRGSADGHTVANSAAAPPKVKRRGASAPDAFGAGPQGHGYAYRRSL